MTISHFYSMRTITSVCLTLHAVSYYILTCVLMHFKDTFRVKYIKLIYIFLIFYDNFDLMMLKIKNKKSKKEINIFSSKKLLLKHSSPQYQIHTLNNHDFKTKF